METPFELPVSETSMTRRDVVKGAVGLATLGALPASWDVSMLAIDKNPEQAGAPIRRRACFLVDLHSARHIERLHAACTLGEQFFRNFRHLRVNSMVLANRPALTISRCSATCPE